MQAKTHSGLETVINVGTGYFIAMALNLFFLPHYAEGIVEQSIWVAAWIGITYTGISMIRSYLFRRLFTHLSESEK